MEYRKFTERSTGWGVAPGSRWLKSLVLSHSLDCGAWKGRVHPCSHDGLRVSLAPPSAVATLGAHPKGGQDAGGLCGQHGADSIHVHVESLLNLDPTM